MDCASSLILCLIGISSAILIYVWKLVNERANMPPGPFPLPVVGNLLQMKHSGMAQSLQELSKKYGPVYTVYLGPKPVVVLCGYDAVKEALEDHGEAFTGRGASPIFDNVIQDFGFSSNGERWKQIRRFSVMTLKNFGMGKRSIEEMIQEEAEFLVKELRKTNESPFDDTHIFTNAVSNVICSVVFGKRFEYEDKEFVKLLNMMTSIIPLLNSLAVQLYFMIPKIMDCLPGAHKRAIRCLEGLTEFVEMRANINLETLDPSSPRDFIDSFLIKMEQEKTNPASEFHMKNLLATVVGLFFAGTETITTTLRHGVLLLLKYPDIEEKIHQEIQQVVGQNRTPALSDRAKMPYTDAVIHEIQRFGDVLPLGIPHTATQDAHFRGFTIPKGTDLLPMLSTVLRDSTQFPNPEEFKPERFLSDSGGIKKNQAFVPFSTGKRSCPGEGMARMELFLFLTTILQKFHLKSVTDPKKLDIRPQFSNFANSPVDFEFCVIPR
ncbi:cytochrome P450 2G1-like [Lissotriton helveticus]